MVAPFFQRGWQVFAPEAAVHDWAAHAGVDAQRALDDPALDHWYQCGGTWFMGLDALANDAQGRVGSSGPLAGNAVDFVRSRLGGWPELHRAQVSAVFPGYPLPREGETEAGFRYRRDRDAAHVDGVLGEGASKRRFVREPHAFILGLPLTRADAGAAPLVVWDGSHLIMQRAFAKAFKGLSDEAAQELDVTEVYQRARREAFDTCPRRILHCDPGGAILVHRLSLHGVAPWEQGAGAAPEGRLIAYFRPPMPGGAPVWARSDP